MTQKTKYVLAGLFAMLLVSLLLYGLDFQQRKLFKEQLKATVVSQLDRLRENLETEVDANFYLTRGLMAYITVHPDLGQETFEVLVEEWDSLRSKNQRNSLFIFTPILLTS